MLGSNRLLDHAFRSELERLSQVTQKTAPGRRRTDKRRAPGRGAVTPAREKAERPVPEDVAMSEFFAKVIKPSPRKALLLVLDASESMEQPSADTGVRKFDQARKLAAALSIVLLAGYDRTQIIAVGQARGNRAPVLKPGTDAKEAALGFLKALRPGGKPRFVHILQRHVKRLAMATDCILLTDMVAPEWEPAMALLANSTGVHTTVVRISDPSEIDEPPFDFSLTSASESPGRALDIDVSRRLRAVQKAYSDDRIDLDDLESGEYLQLLTDQPFERALISALENR